MMATISSRISSPPGLVAYAEKAGGPLGRAAREGYNIDAGAMDHVIARFVSMLEGRGRRPLLPAYPAGSPTDREIELDDRENPSAFALETVDACQGALEDVRLCKDGGPPAEPFEVEIGRVLHATMPDGSKRTVVSVWFEFRDAGRADRCLLVLAEKAS
jgi:hypothetical protein